MSRTLVLFGAALCVLFCAALCITTSCGPKSTAFVDAVFDCTTGPRADLVTALEPTVQSGLQVIKDPSTGKVTTDALQAFFGKPNLETEGGVILQCAEQKVAALLAGLLPPPNTAASALSAHVATGPKVDTASLQAALDQQSGGVKFRVSP